MRDQIDPHRGRQLACSGYTVLMTEGDGTVDASTGLGLFDYDTRILSKHRLLVDGQAPICDSSALIEHDDWAAHLTAPRERGDARGPHLPQDTIGIAIRRRIGNGMLEQLIVRNHSMTAASVTVSLEVAADFADIAERHGPPPRRGRTTSEWNEATQSLTFDHRASHDSRTFHRALRIRIVDADSRPTRIRTGLRFAVELPARAAWRATLVYESLVDERWRSPDRPALGLSTARSRMRESWRGIRASVEAPGTVCDAAVEQAVDDLIALRAWESDVAEDAWVPNAGVPTYTGLFGRDVLTAGWQSALAGPELLRGALARIAATQADDDSAWHDREPGKMVHEMRRGPLADLNLLPRAAYYGSQTTSAMFVVALSEYWHWTGDTAALEHYRTAMLRTFEWARRYGDRDGDGFLEYTRRSSKGLKNHGWKDSDEAIRYPDGRIVEDPIATVEEQAYHWIALQRAAEIFVALGEDQRSEEFLDHARQLRRRWHDAFWMPDEGFYAMAIGPDKEQVRSIGSNPGHAIAAGLVPTDHARRCADRLMADDLFSGWGIRTLSANHPSYNPLGYHLGTVWPVENATFALGFKRYGLDDHVERLATAMFEAAAHFRHHRLPEAIAGYARGEPAVPAVYPGANSPQAWSASAIVQLLQSLLGIYAFAPAQTLVLVRPRLPEWLPRVTVKRIRVGDARASIRFERGHDGFAGVEVIDRSGTLFVLEVPPPQNAADPVTWGDAFKTFVFDRLPGRLATAMRIAVGHES
jgi:glycogen debranching enzyme